MDIGDLKKRIFIDLTKVKDLAELEQFRIKYLGRKGEITFVLKSLKDLSIAKRKKLGTEANQFKKEIESKIENLKSQLIKQETKTKEREKKIEQC